ncbi:MAG: aldehyde dehydrogenase family protein [Candidatus Omnitrophica bacterium]|nr:aldehyde dehydrogenase family protein [Candidatus Omnitrophota bacterium]
MIPHYHLFIDGEFKDSGASVDVINPATDEPIATINMAHARDVEAAIISSRRAYDQGPWRALPYAQRKDYILKIARGILDRAQELATLESLNSGKPIKETTFMDVPSAAQTFEYFANNFERFLQEDVIKIQSPIAHAQADLIREPRGVVVLIVPWNYPLLITSWKLAQALAAGNTVILKPSSLTPLTALELGKIIAAAKLPKGVVNIITGSGEVIGEQLCADSRVDMISFTGSNSVGKKILEYTSAHVKKTIMELGGKSASIVLADADLELAVNGSLCSIFLNQGQMCTAMSRILVEDGIYEKFVADFINKAQRIKLGEATDFETQMGPLISREQREKVIACIEGARAQGATIACGGTIPAALNLQKGFFFEPTVITEATSSMAIFQEEVFGPVVCIHRFSDIQQALELANDSDFGLAAAVWTRNVTSAQELAQKINAGTVWINTYGMFFNELPYGGFKQSGFGKELGREGFLEYTRLKNTLTDTTPEGKPLVNYWYGF